MIHYYYNYIHFWNNARLDGIGVVTIVDDGVSVTSGWWVEVRTQTVRCNNGCEPRPTTSKIFTTIIQCSIYTYTC